MVTSRLALCDTDHASSTGDVGRGVFCTLGDAEALREWAMRTRFVVVIKWPMRSPNFGSAEHRQWHQTVSSA